MTALTLVVIVVATVAASALVILGLRGRFGTVGERGTYGLKALARSDEVPKRTRLQAIATGRGSTLRGKSLIGAGVLWLTDDEVGFVRRTPRQRLTIDLRTVTSVSTSPVYRRDGLEDVSPDDEFLILEWAPAGTGATTIAWLVPDPADWAHAIERARH